MNSEPEILFDRKGAAGIVTLNRPKALNAITHDMIRQLTRCRIISRFGIGVDNVDIPEATKKNIVVTKVPDYCIDEVSDHAMALLLAVVRKIPMISAQVHKGTWKMPNVVPIRRLRGSTIGLVGFGRIPQLVVPKAKSFGMTVIGAAFRRRHRKSLP